MKDVETVPGDSCWIIADLIWASFSVLMEEKSHSMLPAILTILYQFLNVFTFYLSCNTIDSRVSTIYSKAPVLTLRLHIIEFIVIIIKLWATSFKDIHWYPQGDGWGQQTKELGNKVVLWTFLSSGGKRGRGGEGEGRGRGGGGEGRGEILANRGAWEWD